jgi:anti-anti-sigma factor
MPEAFSVVEEAPTYLKLKLDRHALDGESPDLFAYVSSAIEEGRHRDIIIDAEDAYIVNLEGVAILMRLHRRAEAVGVRFIIVVPHRVLERKLELTGVLDLLTEPSPEGGSS